ncbi:MAG TPA: beta-ketoacyl synthase N-terminal-like domain-containing protein, partial [Kofleriaceae bacterium]|nr:beta-ketoacyl synthase N-terminal-like domain-containing protein [Kofleriaceae bacterium]
GRVRGFDPSRWLGRLPRAYYERYDREQQLYLASLMIAIGDAGLDLATIPRERIGIFDGTSRGNFDYWYERIRSEHVDPITRRDLLAGTPSQAANLAASLLGVRGPVYTFNITCCSGAVAIGQACRELAHGEIEVAFASGHDSALETPMYRMYRDAGLLTQERDDARRAIRPYVDHSRNAFGEGAITLVLETREHAARRGATPLATIAGWKLGNNGGHPLHVDAEGGRAARLIADVLAAADVDRREVGVVVGHGNGVEQSDHSELTYMQRVFASRASQVPLLSVKPVYGHLFGAASTLNVAAAILMLHHGWLVPTLNVDPARTGEIDHLASGGRHSDAAAALAVSYGIGGHSSVTLVGRAEAA